MKKFLLLIVVFLSACSVLDGNNSKPSEDLFSTDINENHKLLKKLEGQWIVESKIWIDPTKAPEISKGTASNKLILGGRFLEQEYHSNMMGTNFDGHGYIGFDNFKQKFVSIWIDNFTTQILSSEGSYDSNSKSIIMNGKFFCPVLKQELKSREVTELIDDSHIKFTMYSKAKKAKETKMFEIYYSKKES